jgi:hypothetical protein
VPLPSSELARRRDDDLLLGPRLRRRRLLDLLDDVHPLDDLAKDDVPPVEPRREHGRQEELRAVGVGAGVRHREQADLVVLQGKGLWAIGFSTMQQSATANQRSINQHNINQHNINQSAQYQSTSTISISTISINQHNINQSAQYQSAQYQSISTISINTVNINQHNINQHNINQQQLINQHNQKSIKNQEKSKRNQAKWITIRKKKVSAE